MELSSFADLNSHMKNGYCRSCVALFFSRSVFKQRNIAYLSLVSPELGVWLFLSEIEKLKPKQVTDCLGFNEKIIKKLGKNFFKCLN